MAKLWGLSDLHVGHPANRDSLKDLPSHPHDWLVAAGDIGETEDHLRWAFDLLVPRFSRVVWVPGNHELWTMSGSPLSGLAKYERMVEVCRSYEVLTPEDPYETLPGTDLLVVPMFLLYDYSFCPPGMSPAEAVAWAAEDGIQCVDEVRLDPSPYPSRQAWCGARVAETERRLRALPPGTRTILINHWPLREDVCRLPRIPRFTPWCGTKRTEEWHRRYGAELVLSGHLHLRATDWRDGVRFEEISLGYPRQWKPEKGAAGYLRQVWPATLHPAPGETGPLWHR